MSDIESDVEPVDDYESADDAQSAGSDVDADAADSESAADSDADDTAGLPAVEADASSADVLEVIVVNPEDRITSDVMTLAEITHVIGTRATQIDNGGPVFIDIPGVSDAETMAREELIKRMCPLKIVRVLYQKDGKKICEEWDVNEMELPHGYITNSHK